MDIATAHQILKIQDMMREDLEYHHLLTEHDILNAQFLKTVEALTQEQKDAIFDYIGLLIEFHLRTLEYTVS